MILLLHLQAFMDSLITLILINHVHHAISSHKLRLITSCIIRPLVIIFYSSCFPMEIHSCVLNISSCMRVNGFSHFSLLIFHWWKVCTLKWENRVQQAQPQHGSDNESIVVASKCPDHSRHLRRSRTLKIQNSTLSWELNVTNGTGFRIQNTEIWFNEWRVVHGL